MASSSPASELKRMVVEHYEELHALAAKQMGRESPTPSLETTGLLNEAVLRMLEAGKPLKIKDADHFLALAQLIMKRICIDRARRRRTAKAGGGHPRTELSAALADSQGQVTGLLIIQEELQRLERDEPEAARIVALRYQGYSIEEAAEMLHLPRSTAYDLWNFGRAWLLRVFQEPSAEKR
jgi:RNA polymerase sigma factor (TIGR02999 family)